MSDTLYSKISQIHTSSHFTYRDYLFGNHGIVFLYVSFAFLLINVILAIYVVTVYQAMKNPNFIKRKLAIKLALFTLFIIALFLFALVHKPVSILAVLAFAIFWLISFFIVLLKGRKKDVQQRAKILSFIPIPMTVFLLPAILFSSVQCYHFSYVSYQIAHQEKEQLTYAPVVQQYMDEQYGVKLSRKEAEKFSTGCNVVERYALFYSRQLLTGCAVTTEVKGKSLVMFSTESQQIVSLNSIILKPKK